MTRLPVAVTRTGGFSCVSGKDLFYVAQGVPIVDALEQASNLLSCVETLAVTIGTETHHGAEIFAVQYLAEMARALVDAAAGGALVAEDRP